MGGIIIPFYRFVNGAVHETVKRFIPGGGVGV
jgi:hypothetical protein